MNLNRFSILARTRILVLGGFWLVLLIIGLSLYQRMAESFAVDTQLSLQGMVENFDAQVVHVADQLLTVSSLFSRHPEVLKAYALAQPGHAEPSDDNPHYTAARDHLRSVMAAYTGGFGANHDSRFSLHFHLPNARSLWRVWNERQSRSDDLAGFRETILAVTRPPHAVAKGIEIGVGGFAIRAVLPLIDDGRFMGSVEYLGDFDAVFNSLLTESNQVAALLMPKEFLSIATSLNDATRYPVLGGEQVLVAATLPGLFANEGFYSSFSHAMRTQGADFSSSEYNMVYHPIRSFDGREVGYLVLGISQERLLSQRAQLRNLILVVAVSGSILFVGILMVLNRSLKAVMAVSENLTESAFTIRSSAAEIASSSQQLADGASEQAASLEQKALRSSK